MHRPSRRRRVTMPAPWIRTAIGAQATLLVGMGLGRFSYTPMVPALIDNGAVSADQAGWIGAANLGGYLVGGLAVPWLLQRAAAPVILRSCLMLSFAALSASAVPAGFAWLLACRLLLGIAVAVMMILSIASVTAAAPAQHLGKAAGIAFTGVGLGIFFSAAALPLLLSYGLLWAWVGTAAIGAVGLGLGLWGWSGGSDAPPPVRNDPLPIHLSADAARLVAAQGLFSVGLVPHSIYWVDYLVRGLGWSIAEGGAQWTLFGLGACPDPTGPQTRKRQCLPHPPAARRPTTIRRRPFPLGPPRRAGSSRSRTSGGSGWPG